MKRVNDLRINSCESLISPNGLKNEFTLSEKEGEIVFNSREIIKNIIHRKDDRLLAIIGPCSIHNEESAYEYADLLNDLRNDVKDKIYIVMRVYFEKPRTTVGWRGLITDPKLDGTYDIENGLRISRRIMKNILNKGIPIGSEMLDPIVPQYIADCVSWSAIGARTTESQTHRQLASGLSMPTGFKNATNGDIMVAINAVSSSYSQHNFIGIDQMGKTCIFETTGNKDVHIILRGGASGPNYYEEEVEKAVDLMKSNNIEESIVIDCSHMNSGKDHEKQERVLRNIIDQKNRTNNPIVGFMVESNLNPGNQPIPKDLNNLKYGVSITDPCIGWNDTKKMIMEAYNNLK